MTEEGYWRFCDVVERTNVPNTVIATPPETERAVLEQHTGTGEYRLRSLDEVLTEASEGD